MAIFFALCSNVLFAFSSTLYAEYSRRVSPGWMNFHKALVALVCFVITATALDTFVPLPMSVLLLFFISGFAGLFIGDTFMLHAFTELGSGRTLMVYGFQPLLIGVLSYFLLGQTLPIEKFVAVLFFIGCLASFSFESAKYHGHWGIKGLLFAVAAIALDGGGMVLTRMGFDASPGISPFYVNVIRTMGAMLGFLSWSFLRGKPQELIQPFLKLSAKDRTIVTVAGFLGTFLSLSFYLHAVQIGHLATISAIAGTSPLLATIVETFTGRRPLTKHLVIGAACFLIGFMILTLT